MCGILGILDFSGRGGWSYDHFARCLEMQHHRGPDDGGIFQAAEFILGHRRLSILDLDRRSAQPMVSADSRQYIVFNGEIFNYRELRAELEQRGLRFRTQSDTEVLLQGLICHGIDFIQRCIGMFAFCFVDTSRCEAYIVRDRLGIKPVFYSRDGNRVSFSSTTGSLHALRPGSAFSPEALSSYLSFRYPIGSRTFFTDIQSLEPGEYLKVTATGVERTVYWDPSHLLQEQVNDKGEAYYLENLRELIASSVRYRLVSDVPVGAYLSGGVDSSGLVATMARLSNAPVNTFTIGFGASGYNEFEYAREVARQYHTTHREIEQTSADYLESMRQLIRYKGAPLAVPNEIPIWALSRELKKYITVVLSGEGADELFMGYGRIFRSAYDYARIGDKLPWSSAERHDEFLANARKKYGSIDFSSELDHFLRIYAYIPYAAKRQLLSGDLPLESYEANFRREFSALFDKAGETDYENRISYTFIKAHLPGLLQRLDNATMAASVEGRVPFVDHRIVEFALTVPLHYKLKWKTGVLPRDVEHLTSDAISETYDTPKYLLKRAFEDVLSENILYRKKVGFPVPLHAWFKGEFRSVAHDILLSTAARNRGLYNTRVVEQWLSDPDVGENHSRAMNVWMLLNAEIFFAEHA